MRRFACFGIACAVAAAASACTSPANVAGTYTVDITDEANGCNLMGFTQGQSTSNIPVTIMQQDASITIDVTGAAGVYVMTVLGSSSFDGTVDGDSFSATLFGTTHATMSNCSYTFDADLEGKLSGDAISGTIAYTPKTNGSPDCSTIDGCTSTQDYSGTRPPP